MGVTGTTYTYTCDVCARGYEKKSKLPQVDGGAKLLSQYYMKCDECGKFACKDNCWNYKKGTCITCNELVLPEYTMKKGKVRTEYFYICSICRTPFGPIQETDWSKIGALAKTVTKIALGGALIATGVGAVSGARLAADGIGDAAGGLGSKVGKSAAEVETSAKTNLIQCPDCQRWICEDCWDKTVGKCNGCSA